MDPDCTHENVEQYPHHYCIDCGDALETEPDPDFDLKYEKENPR